MKTFLEYFKEAFEPKRIAERELELLFSVRSRVEDAHSKIEMWLKVEEEMKELKYLLTNYLDRARILSEKMKVEHLPTFEKIADLTKVHELRGLREVHDLVRETKKLRAEKKYTLKLDKKFYDDKDEKMQFFTGDDKNVTFYFKSDGEVFIFYPSKWKTNSKVEGRYTENVENFIVTFKATPTNFEKILSNVQKDSRILVVKDADFSYYVK